MDSLTHIVLGACISEVVGKKENSGKLLLTGAIANSLPDIDFVASFWMPLTSDLLAHRGFTHSILFIVLATPLLAYASMKLLRSIKFSFRRWLLFWSLQMTVHIFIDSFNAYGTGWFEPFSHYRVSFNSMFVADPLFTIWPIAATIALFVASKENKNRKKWAISALAVSTVYLFIGLINKTVVDATAKKQLVQSGVVPDRYFSTPTPLNNVLWYIVSEQDSGFYVGYRSLFDANRPMHFRFVCKNNYLLDECKNQEDIAKLKRFSQGFYTAELWHDTVVFNDLRFGEIIGWSDSLPQCVFYYYPQIPDANELVVQRGRFAKWDGAAIKTFIRRIAGN